MIFALDLPPNKDAIVTTRNIRNISSFGTESLLAGKCHCYWVGAVDPRFPQEMNFLILSQAIIS